jgi:hypothetical protein
MHRIALDWGRGTRRLLAEAKEKVTTENFWGYFWGYKIVHKGEDAHG